MPRLELTVRGRPVRTLELSASGLTIGRDPGNDLVLDDPALSRRHARVVRREGVDVLEDGGSRNGVFVADTRLKKPHRLAAGDVVTLGTYSFKYRDGPPAPQPRRASPESQRSARSRSSGTSFSTST